MSFLADATAQWPRCAGNTCRNCDLRHACHCHAGIPHGRRNGIARIERCCPHRGPEHKSRQSGISKRVCTGWTVDKDGVITSETPADDQFLVFPPQGVLPAGGQAGCPAAMGRRSLNWRHRHRHFMSRWSNLPVAHLRPAVTDAARLPKSRFSTICAHWWLSLLRRAPKPRCESVERVKQVSYQPATICSREPTDLAANAGRCRNHPAQ